MPQHDNLINKKGMYNLHIPFDIQTQDSELRTQGLISNDIRLI